MLRKITACVLSAAIVLLSAGTRGYQALAQEVVAPKVHASPVAGAGISPVGVLRFDLGSARPDVGTGAPLSGTIVVPVGGSVKALPGLETHGMAALSPAASLPAVVAPGVSPRISPAVPGLAPAVFAPKASPFVPGAGLAGRPAAARGVAPAAPGDHIRPSGATPGTAGRGVAPAAPQQPEQSRFEKMVADLEAPSPLSGVSEASSSEDRSAAANTDFDIRLGQGVPGELQDAVGGASPSGQPAGLARGAAALGLSPARQPVPAALGTAAMGTPSEGLGRPDRRSALFGPAIAAALSAVLLAVQAVLTAVGRGLALVSPTALSDGQGGAFAGLLAAAGIAGIAAGVAAAVCATGGVLAVAAFRSAMGRGRGVSDEDFREFVRGEVLAGRLDAGAASLLRVYRPTGRFDFSYGAHLNGRLYLRPELAKSPRLFQVVLAHELEHLRDRRTRGPPARGLAGLWERLKLEIKARWREFKPAQAVGSFRLPVLERALNQAQLSLRRDDPYDVLVLNPGSSELADPEVYRQLSGGKARVETVRDADPLEVLKKEENEERFKAVVVDRLSGVLPEKDSIHGRKLEKVLRSLDDLYVLATRLTGREDGFEPGSKERRRYLKLAEAASHLQPEDKRAAERFERRVRLFWRDIARAELDDLAVSGFIGSLYGALADKGMAFISLGPEDRGVAVWEKLLRFWEAAEGGHFKVTRVDLESGGHILAARKSEARVGMWIRPRAGTAPIPVSVERVSSSPEKAQRTREMLEAAGLGEQLKKLESLGAEIRDVYGADVGRQELYVSVPRTHAAAIRRMGATGSLSIEEAQTGFEPQMMDSPELQDVPPVWRSGFTGRNGSILLIGTGGDAAHEDFGGRLEVVDRVGEGPEDWVGHETVTSSIALGDGKSYLGRIAGIARGAMGIVAKVFSRDAPGAADGDIKASVIVALERGVDVINVSLGSRGTSGDDLSRFLSDVSLKKNSKGEYIIVAGSFGNAGPLDRTGSQPSTGVNVIATAAAAKSLSDGVPEIAFYSSVGPDIDPRYSIKRVRLKPDITAIGGDVVTEGGDPDVYKYGVTAAKSKSMPPGPSDSRDGRHTRMSGTSMASPMIAGIALLLKLAMKAAGADTPFVNENLPLAVRAILMRTATDMEVPVWFQGAGLVDAWKAVQLVNAAGTKAIGSWLKRSWRRLWSKPPPAAQDDWGWIERLKAAMEIEDKVYATVEIGRREPEVRIEEEAEGAEPKSADQDPGDATPADAQKRFGEARKEALPKLLEALKDPVWVVRRQAALVLLNFKEPSAAVALAEAALNDPDNRVRQAAFMALAETPTHAMDELLRKASSHENPAIGVYAAYALARHGDAFGVGRLERALASQDKRLRFTATWLLGQIGRRLGSAQTGLLSARVRDESERGNIRHLAVAALINIVAGKPEAIGDQAVTDLLDASGPQNMALTRTIAKFFSSAMQSKDLRARMKEGALRDALAKFIQKHRSSTAKPGGLGEMVRLFARHLDIPLDAPTPVPSPQGLGVEGVDPAMGPLDLIVRPAGKDGVSRETIPAAVLSRFEAEVKEVLPLSGLLWVKVPEHKLFAFNYEMRRLGLAVSRSAPEYSTGGKPSLTVFKSAGSVIVGLDGGAGSAQGGRVVAGASFSPLPGDGSANGVSEARVMAALEKVYAGLANPLADPTIVLLGVGAPGLAQGGQALAGAGRSPIAGAGGAMRPLNLLINRLVLNNVGVLAGSGNEGPGVGSLPGPARSRLAVVVAAVGADNAPESYSGRGTPGDPSIAWADRGEGPEPGTAAAAANSGRKLSLLAGRMAAELLPRLGSLPDGYFLYLAELVKSSLTPLPGAQPYEVGAGLFGSESAALKALEEDLRDPQKLAAKAAGLLARAKSSQ